MINKFLLSIVLTITISTSFAQSGKVVIPTAVTTVKKTFSELLYSDGWKGTLEGSNTLKRRDSLWLANHTTFGKPVFSPPSGDYVTMDLVNYNAFVIGINDPKFIKIKPGNYINVIIKTFQNIENLVIDATGVIIENGGIDFKSGRNISIYGLEIKNAMNRAVKFDFGIDDFKMYNAKFSNCGDMVIASEALKEYDGTAATINKGFKLINCSFDNCSAIGLTGNFDKDIKQDLGRFENPEIAYNTWKNSRTTGKVLFASNVSGYNVHHNVVDNMNQDNNNHNGIFEMQGNGKFHDNKFTNYQGNSIRAWLFTWGSTPSTVEIYNNICYNTRKYSGFEIQQMPRHIWPGKTTFANAKVYNNTVGRMNTSRDWEGQVLDLYNISGTLNYYNNLGFDLYRINLPVSGMINNMSDTKIISTNNRYYLTSKDAVNDLTTFTSKIIGVGAKL